MLKEKIPKDKKPLSINSLNSQKSGSAFTGIYCAVRFYSHAYTHYYTFGNYIILFFLSTGPQLYSVHSVQ